MLELIFYIKIINTLTILNFCNFQLLFITLFSFLIGLCLLGLCCSFVLFANSMCCLGNRLLERNYPMLAFLSLGLLSFTILLNLQRLLHLGRFLLLFRLVLLAWIVHIFDLFLLGWSKKVRWKILSFVRHRAHLCKLVNDLGLFFLEVIQGLKSFGLICHIFLLICARLSRLIVNLFRQNCLLFVREVLFWLTFSPWYFVGLRMAPLLKSFLFKSSKHLILYQIFISLLLLQNSYLAFYDDVFFNYHDDFIFLKFYNFLKIEFIYFCFFFFTFFKFLRV